MSMIQVRHSTEVEIPETTATRLLSQLLGQVAQDPGQSAVKVRVTTAPRIGQPWPGQGGVYAGIMRGHDGKPDYHLIVPADPAAYTDGITWGPRGRDIEGAKCEWDGRANTFALYSDGRDHPAAEWAYGLDIDGHNDFYLPSRRELRLMWTNVPELFEPGWYWSSTQCSAGNAWLQGFGDGTQNILDKDGEYRARAVRRLII